MRPLCFIFVVAVIVSLAVPASAQDRFGSIVFSKHSDGGYAWGMAWSFDSRSSARNRAINECLGRGGRSCGEVAWFRNACGALAIGTRHGARNGVGWGWGNSIAVAQNGALSGCRSNGNSNCQIAISRCAQ